jgi:hypothetical protein
VPAPKPRRRRAPAVRVPPWLLGSQKPSARKEKRKLKPDESASCFSLLFCKLLALLTSINELTLCSTAAPPQRSTSPGQGEIPVESLPLQVISGYYRDDQVIEGYAGAATSGSQGSKEKVLWLNKQKDETKGSLWKVPPLPPSSTLLSIDSATLGGLNSQQKLHKGRRNQRERTQWNKVKIRRGRGKGKGSKRQRQRTRSTR